MNKRGLSGIVATVIMIALVVAITGIVWMVITNMVSEQLDEAGSCLDIQGQFYFNGEYTCYDTETKEFRFALAREDLDVDEIVISISSEGSTKSYTLVNGSSTDKLKLLNGSNAILPDKNEGFTYVTTLNSYPDKIQVRPVVNGKQCDVADSITEFAACFLLE